MKKLICGFLGFATSAAFAVESEAVSTIDVIKVESPLTNVVVAIPGFDLSGGGDLAISNLIKTTGLTVGDDLFAFDGTNYKRWTLDGNGIWQANDTSYVYAGGQIDISGTPAADTPMPVGQGIWLRRAYPTNFYVYAVHDATPSITVDAGATVLLGNPLTTDKAPTITGAEVGDLILVPTATFTSKYRYNGSAFVGLKGNLPAIVKGTGFWYKAESTGSTRTVSW